MKKQIFAEKLGDYIGEEITEAFLLESIKHCDDTGGKREYLEFCFLDKTGGFSGYLFRDYMKREYYSYRKKVVLVTGQVILRKDSLPKLYLSQIEECREYDDLDYYHGLVPEEEKLYLEIIQRYAEKITHSGYQAVVKGAYMIYGERIAKGPASLKEYNNYNGGILVHTVAVAGIAVYSAKILARYTKGMREPDFNLLVAAALLHEIGKIEQYTAYPFARRVDEGVLISSSNFTIQLIRQVMHACSIQITREDEYLLYHVIEACTSKDKFVRPMCVEAVILQYAYLMQTRIEAISFFQWENSKRTGSIYDERLNNYIYVKKEEAMDDGI